MCIRDRIQSEPNPTTLCQYARCLYIKKLGDIMTDFVNVEKNAKNLKALLGLLSEMPCAKDKLVEGLIHDIHSDNKEEGQLGKALQSKEYLDKWGVYYSCLLYTSPSPRDLSTSRMPSSA
eukprot:TRINITY_DN30117_c0_g1_i1.p1 TRINITY_DN30117_c0_g1~~TRINITY_DN30117_c0_g1_i1.p1  ORF type:complete len:120 (-),score=27.32 TRINITY_DN30117_c0_g1_i1:51-410(-)